MDHAEVPLTVIDGWIQAISLLLLHGRDVDGHVSAALSQMQAYLADDEPADTDDDGEAFYGEGDAAEADEGPQHLASSGIAEAGTLRGPTYTF